ncbi:hypothetical protein ABZZ79_35690 [Streptomyces sp. NPDC006458]|uniref:hypothetical protein n=1 Tax=Streptomyces sp. NPDC006458 TaxID=3154302 RepID=UPI0033A02742
MPSVTYWNRVEPTPHSDSLVRGLEAPVRDPLWFLARQWQLGEFQGEDAASPAYVTFTTSTAGFEGWRSGPGPFTRYDGSPLEALTQTEEATPDWRTAVELGHALLRELTARGTGQDMAAAVRAAFPVPRPEEADDAERADPALTRFLRVCGGRAVDGLTARAAAQAAAPAPPPELTLPPGQDPAPVTAAFAAFLTWADEAYGALGRADAPAWRADRLDYEVEVLAATPGGGRDRLSARAGPDGEYDWYSFDVAGAETAGPAPTVTTTHSSLFPTRPGFAGLPHGRWWQFEDARYNWAALDADRRELAKTLVLDFMLVHGDDWFTVPLGRPVGSVQRIDQLLVRDVFDEWTLVDRADAEDDDWTMFSLSDPAGGRADYCVLPPSALRATVDGPVIEEVRFLRDEQANIVWALEVTTENGVGRPWDGRERALTVTDAPPADPPTAAPLRYRLQTTVPVNWIPFLPVRVDATGRAVALQRAAMQRFADGALESVPPVGRVLTPDRLTDPAVYQVREEEVERSGTRILRSVRRARWLGGRTCVWVSRRRRAGFGEGASGLAYDRAEETGSGN